MSSPSVLLCRPRHLSLRRLTSIATLRRSSNSFQTSSRRLPAALPSRRLSKFFTNVLRWDDGDLEDAPADLEFALPEYGEVLQASYAVREPEPADTDKPWMMLLKVLPHGDDFDTPSAAADRGWNASPEAKFERLLREAEVPIGLLLNATHIRLVYSPRGETSGYLTFPVAAMTEVAGRPVLAALEMLLSAERLFSLAKGAAPPSDSRRQPALSERRINQARRPGSGWPLRPAPRIAGGRRPRTR